VFYVASSFPKALGNQLSNPKCRQLKPQSTWKPNLLPKMSPAQNAKHLETNSLTQNVASSNRKELGNQLSNPKCRLLNPQNTWKPTF